MHTVRQTLGRGRALAHGVSPPRAKRRVTGALGGGGVWHFLTGLPPDPVVLLWEDVVHALPFHQNQR